MSSKTEKPPFIDSLEMPFDKILTEFCPLQDKKSLLEIPEMSQEIPVRHKVLKAGTGKVLPNGQRVEMIVKPGDIIWAGKWAGSDVLGNPYRIFRMDEIFGIER